MPMILLCISSEALAKVQNQAVINSSTFDAELSAQFEEFLVQQKLKERTAPAATPEPVDGREILLAKILQAAEQIEGPFTFNDVIAAVPELAAMQKGETTQYASLFSRRYADSGNIAKIGKNSNKATEYQVHQE